MYRAFRIINNQYGGCVVYIHDVSIHNASELTFAKTGNCPNVSHISHCVLEHFIFLNFLGGGPPNPPPPPQEKVANHQYSHHNISKPPFTNPIYTHIITAL